MFPQLVPKYKPLILALYKFLFDWLIKWPHTQVAKPPRLCAPRSPLDSIAWSPGPVAPLFAPRRPWQKATVGLIYPHRWKVGYGPYGILKAYSPSDFTKRCSTFFIWLFHQKKTKQFRVKRWWISSKRKLQAVYTCIPLRVYRLLF